MTPKRTKNFAETRATYQSMVEYSSSQVNYSSSREITSSYESCETRSVYMSTKIPRCNRRWHAPNGSPTKSSRCTVTYLRYITCTPNGFALRSPLGDEVDSSRGSRNPRGTQVVRVYTRLVYQTDFVSRDLFGDKSIRRVSRAICATCPPNGSHPAKPVWSPCRYSRLRAARRVDRNPYGGEKNRIYDAIFSWRFWTQSVQNRPGNFEPLLTKHFSRQIFWLENVS